MWFHSLLASWKSGPSRSPLPQPRSARRRPRLTVEHLEDRTLPSSYSAASVSALIADIDAANKAGGANTISLTAPITSPYALTAANNTVNGPNGLPVIAAKDNLTIVGNGDTIESSTGNLDFRLLGVASGASLTLQSLTLKGGLAYGHNSAAEGGTIYNQGALTLSGVTVEGNRAVGPVGSGSPAAGGGIWSNGSLTLENGTLLEGNSARGGQSGPYSVGGAAYGGAVYVAGGTANITNTTVTGNYAEGGLGQIGDGKAFGGAVYVAAGQVVITTTTVNDNEALGYFNVGDASYGGGLYVAGGTAILSGDTVESNTLEAGTGYGGGLFIAKGATVSIDAFTLANVVNNTVPTDPNIDGIFIAM